MKIIVIKKPDAYTLTRCREVGDADAVPNGWEVMTRQAHAAYKQSEIAGGWTPATVPLTPSEIEREANKAERLAVKDLFAQITSDIDASSTDQAQAQAYIDLAAPTNQQRNDEVLNSAKRDKSNAQRYRRLARAVKQLVKDL